jgi:hypothetical protein
MPSEFSYAPLLAGEIDALADALHNEAVYEFIGGRAETISSLDFSVL